MRLIKKAKKIGKKLGQAKLLTKGSAPAAAASLLASKKVRDKIKTSAKGTFRNAVDLPSDIFTSLNGLMKQGPVDKAASMAFQGYGQRRGQEEANEANTANARELRDWQENMSNTSYQRGTADMTAAGVNPMLAIGQGGAGTPSGAMAEVENEGAGESVLDSAVNSAKAVQNVQAGAQAIKNAQAEEKNIKADTGLKLANTQDTLAEMPMSKLKGDAAKTSQRMTSWISDMATGLGKWSAKMSTADSIARTRGRSDSNAKQIKNDYRSNAGHL